MYRSFIRSCLALATLATSLGLGTVAHASYVEEVQIPSQLVSTPEPDDPNGACSKCRVNSLQAAQDATVALFTYLRDQHQVPAAQLPAHGPQRSGVPLPRRTAQYGYQAVWDAIQAAEQGHDGEIRFAFTHPRSIIGVRG